MFLDIEQLLGGLKSIQVTRCEFKWKLSDTKISGGKKKPP